MKYTLEMRNFLSETAPGKPLEVVTQLFNKKFKVSFDKKSIKGVMNYIGVDRNRKPTKEHIQFLRDNAHLTETQLWLLFNEHFKANEKLGKIRGVLQRYGIISKRIKAKDFTPVQIQFLRDNAYKRSCGEITKLFNDFFNENRTEKQIAGVLGKKRIRRFYYDNTNNRNKGNRTHNRGRPNILPIGTEVVTDKKRGVTYIKISDVEGEKHGINKKGTWERKHIYLYKQANSEIPEGYNVIFLDNNKTNFELDNLAIATRNEIIMLSRLGFIFNDREMTKTGLAIIRHKATAIKAMVRSMGADKARCVIQRQYYNKRKQTK